MYSWQGFGAMRVVAIVQARMGATRLPGKVLADLAGEPMLARVVQRVCRASKVDDVVVATTTTPGDASVAQLCEAYGWNCFRGSEEDVLDRFYQAAIAYGAEAVVRICADCPLIEAEILDLVIGEFLERQPKVDYAVSFLPERTFPVGLDAQVVRFDALERAWREDTNPVWREGVTYYIDLNPELFHVHTVSSTTDHSAYRWTVDQPEDLAFMRRIYEHFGHDHFSWHDVIAVLRRFPEWQEINRHVEQKRDLTRS